MHMQDDLSAARLAALRLRKRSGFENLATMLLRNIDLQRKWPKDRDFKAAGARLGRAIERRAGEQR